MNNYILEGVSTKEIVSGELRKDFKINVSDNTLVAVMPMRPLKALWYNVRLFLYNRGHNTNLRFVKVEAN